jgi:hypothetical protein
MKNVLSLFLILLLAGCSGSGQTEDRSEARDIQTLREGADLEFRLIDTGYRNAVSIDYTSSDDVLFIVEQGRNRILRLSSDGIRTDSVGSRGSGDYRFDRPSSVDATNGLQIFVADQNNARIQLFERRLSYISTIRAPGDRQGINPVFFSPALVTVNSFGDVFVYDAESGQILRYNRNGRFDLAIPLSVTEFEGRAGTLDTHEDRLFIGERESGLLHEFSARGAYRGFLPASRGFRSIYIKAGRIWGADNESVKVLNLNGRELFSFSHNVPDEISGIAVSRRQIFLLTQSGLYSAENPAER